MGRTNGYAILPYGCDGHNIDDIQDVNLVAAAVSDDDDVLDSDDDWDIHDAD